MPTEPAHSLRVLVANEHHEHLGAFSALIRALGHEIVGEHSDIGAIGPASRSTRADIAIVHLGLDGEHALAQISAIVHEAACPVITLIDRSDPAFVQEAAKRGVFAYVVLDHGDDDDVRSAIDITLRRYAEFQNLQGAFGRRALIEQAKGILMERHGIDADTAFQHLKTRSQQTGTKLIDLAEALIDSHLLLRAPRPSVREEG